jgi:hypothetical protein
MKIIFAQYNHGRWIGICPFCKQQGEIVALEVKPGDIFVCPNEYPNLLAKTLIPNPRVPGAFNSIPDKPLQEETHHAAVKAGNGYEVDFPSEKKEIERLLRYRPLQGRNWFPGVTLDDLRLENKERGLTYA